MNEMNDEANGEQKAAKSASCLLWTIKCTTHAYALAMVRGQPCAEVEAYARAQVKTSQLLEI